MANFDLSLGILATNQGVDLTSRYKKCSIMGLDYSDNNRTSSNIAQLAVGELKYSHRNAGESKLEWTNDSLELIYKEDAIRHLTTWLWDECIDKLYLMWSKERPEGQKHSSSVKTWLCMRVLVSGKLTVKLPQKRTSGIFLCFQMKGFDMPLSKFVSEKGEFFELFQCDSIECSIMEPDKKPSQLMICQKKSGPIEILRLCRSLSGTSYQVIFQTLLSC